MDGHQALAKTEATQQMQENDGIAAAGKADADAFGRRQTGREKIADPPGQHVS